VLKNEIKLIIKALTCISISHKLYVHFGLCSDDNPSFYQHLWNLFRDGIFKECCAWLDTCHFPPDLNMTNIALIPKGNMQTCMKDWRPIALCNVLYKLISKVPAN